MRLLSILSALALSASALAQTAPTSEAPPKALVVAELFTSQSCSSCPSAEKLFSKLADNEDLLTLEWHVDYWDRLVHGGSSWKDPYSSKAYTDRQRAYNRSLRGQSGVYTPQAVINGHFEGVGSRRAEVSDMIAHAPALSVPVTIQNGRVSVDATDENADILFVRLLKSHETNVKGGENKGRKLSGKNIVLEMERLGETGSAPAELKLPLVKEGETCAVIVQDLAHDLSPVLGAAKCA